MQFQFKTISKGNNINKNLLNNYYTLNKLNNLVVVEITAVKLDIYNSANIFILLYNNLNDYIQTENIEHVIINMENISDIDSVGIGGLLNLYNNLPKNHDIKLSLVNLSLGVKKVFSLTKYIKYFNIYNSTEEAVNIASDKVFDFNDFQHLYPSTLTTQIPVTDAR